MGKIKPPDIAVLPREIWHMDGIPVIDTAKFYNLMVEQMKKPEDHKVKTRGQILYYNCGDEFVSINMEEIVYYTGNSKVITIYLKNGNYVTIYNKNATNNSNNAVTNFKEIREIIDNYFENKYEYFENKYEKNNKSN